MGIEQSRYDIWDGLLNKLWQELVNGLRADELEGLKYAQVKWIKERKRRVWFQIIGVEVIWIIPLFRMRRQQKQ